MNQCLKLDPLKNTDCGSFKGGLKTIEIKKRYRKLNVRYIFNDDSKSKWMKCDWDEENKTLLVYSK